MNRKKLLMFGIPILALALVTGAILQYYGQINQTVTVNQAVTLSGEGCIDNVCSDDLGIVYSPDTTLSGIYILTDNDPVNSRYINLITELSPLTVPGEVTTTYVKPLSKDDSANWGSQDKVVEFVTEITLDELFAGSGLQYTYNTLVGGTYDGASPVIAVIDLSDGRHIILFPGWGSRTGENTLTFSDTVATDTGGNNVVDFTVYDSSWVNIWSSNSEYGNWNYLKASGSSTGGALPLAGTDTITGLSLVSQGANTGEEDQIELMIVNGVSYMFIEGDNGDTFTVSPSMKLGFKVKNDFLTTNFDGTITTEVHPVA